MLVGVNEIDGVTVGVIVLVGVKDIVGVTDGVAVLVGVTVLVGVNDILGVSGIVKECFGVDRDWETLYITYKVFIYSCVC